MKSKWFEYKNQALDLRRQGVSMTVIEKEYGIPRSTLSGWFKNIPLTEDQRTVLMKNRRDGWKKAREHAIYWHNQQKAIRLQTAELEAQSTLEKLPLTPEVLDIALAMLYFGEGAKKNRTAIANSNPQVLQFVLTVLYSNYHKTTDDIYCELHLRADQDGAAMQTYWQEKLNLPASCFGYIAYDKRTTGKKTYDNYKGVCVVNCRGLSIQRKLISLYNQFCTKVTSEITGA